jgi:hypothetical protein
MLDDYDPMGDASASKSAIPPVGFGVSKTTSLCKLGLLKSNKSSVTR